MNVSISKQYEEGFSIVVDDATRNEVLAIRSLTDKQQGIALTPVARQQAFIEAARLHFQSHGNKILAIKYIRTLSEPTLNLKDAKDLTDYATLQINFLDWLK